MHMQSRGTRIVVLLTTMLIAGCDPREQRQGDPKSAHILRLAEMNTAQIRALDRSKTVILLVGGILEEHGPYLPSFSDGFMNEWLAERLAETITSRSEWSVVVCPTIPLGVGGANEIGRKYAFPGTYAIRSTTLRSVFMDLASEFGEQGFKWIFVVHAHGAPNHRLALHQAGDYFRDVYGGQMVLLTDLKVPFQESSLSAEERAEDGGGFLANHANAVETSTQLFVHPNSVAPGYIAARSYTAQTDQEAVAVAKDTDWAGYFGAPRRATVAHGKRIMETFSQQLNDVAIKILDGLDPRQIGRNIEPRANQLDDVSAAALVRELEVVRRQQEWLRRNGYEQ